MSRWKKGMLAWVAMGGVALAQTTPNNEQLVQSFRALLTSGSDTQAVIQAVAEAVREALKQGPMTQAQAQTTLATAPTEPASGAGASLSSVAAALTPPKTWADAITFKGDVRYRVETRQDSSKGYAGNPDIEYERIRARLGAEAKLNDDVKAVIRLTTDGFKGTTAGGDPVSGNQDLTGLASKKFLFLDLAYIDWNIFGEGNSELHGLAGKMVNPFITMNDDLAWD
ncbi:MAG: putative porin, partial [bacterium]